LHAADVDALIAARDRHGVKIGEAFMVRTHPQWLRARELLRSGKIGDLRAVTSFFSYHNTDPNNIRNIPAAGGGALYDIGCYTITTSRFLFESEPRRVAGVIERDPELGTDRLTSAILDYPTGQSIWTVSTQLIPYQRVHALGTAGRIEIEIPFNAPDSRPCRLWLDETGALDNSGISVEEFPVCNQYTVEIDTFSRAIAEGGDIPVPLENAKANMAVIDAVLRSAETGAWVTL
jgi:predicted dehydrogenase